MRTITMIVGGLCLLAGCGTGDVMSDTVVTPVETGTINFAEGAFVRNQPGGATAGDEASGDAGDPDADSGVDPLSTTTTPGSPVGGTTTTVASGSATTVASTSPGTATTTTVGGAATTVAGSSTQLGVNEGIVVIGTVSYSFAAETCDVDDDGFFIFGSGTSSSGQATEVDITGETIDIDGDGTKDLSFDIFVAADLAAGADSSQFPEFYAEKVDTATFTIGEDIVVTVTGTTVKGSGPIEDLNEIAIPSGETLPMTFEVRCG